MTAGPRRSTCSGRVTALPVARASSTICVPGAAGLQRADPGLGGDRLEAIFAELAGNGRPYAAYLPAYAAVAWYHDMVPNRRRAGAVPDRGAAYAAGPLRCAAQGRRARGAELEAVAQKMHDTPGCRRVPQGRQLRVSENAFTHELLSHDARRSAASTAASSAPPGIRSRSRPTTIRSSRDQRRLRFDFLDYYHGELKFGQGATYPHHFAIGEKWHWHRRPRTASSRW